MILRPVRAILLATLVLLLSYHLLLTASMVVSFHLTEPLIDQFRQILRYLTHTFTFSVFALENGHRPIVPGLLRWAELYWLQGRQILQPAVAWLCAAMVFSVLVHAALTSMRAAWLRVVAIICVTGTLLFWAANARMFIHSYEAVHIWIITASLILATWAAQKANHDKQYRWWAVAIFFALTATFTFGSGIATFVAIAALALLFRNTKAMVVIVLMAVLTFIVYFWLLPDPDHQLKQAINANFSSVPFFFFARIGAVFAELFREFIPDFLMRVAFATSIGLVSSVITALYIFHVLIKKSALSRLEIYTFSMVIFAYTVNALIVLNRSEYFISNGDQLLADRYLFWSCIAWVGMLGLWGTQTRHVFYHHEIVFALVIAAISLAAIPSANYIYGWSSAVHRAVKVAGLMGRLNIRSDSAVQMISDYDINDTYGAIDAMRSHQLGVFSHPNPIGIGENIRPNPPSVINVSIIPCEAVTQPKPVSPVCFFTGELSKEIAVQIGDVDLLVIDPNGKVIGMAIFTLHRTLPNRLRLGIPTMNVYQGFLFGTDVSELRLVVKEGNNYRGILGWNARIQ